MHVNGRRFFSPTHHPRFVFGLCPQTRAYFCPARPRRQAPQTRAYLCSIAFLSNSRFTIYNLNHVNFEPPAARVLPGLNLVKGQATVRGDVGGLEIPPPRTHLSDFPTHHPRFTRPQVSLAHTSDSCGLARYDYTATFQITDVLPREFRAPGGASQNRWRTLQYETLRNNLPLSKNPQRRGPWPSESCRPYFKIK